MHSLESMINWLESEGFHLWFDQGEWILFPGEELDEEKDIYSLKGNDKMRIIQEAFNHLAH